MPEPRDDSVGNVANGPADENPTASRGTKGTRAKRATRTKKAARRRRGTPVPASRKRNARPFPAASLEESLVIGQAIQQVGGGQDKVRRLTLFEHLKKSPDSGPSRQLISNSFKYGITVGSYKADWLELTPTGRTATSDDVPDPERRRARFPLAVEGIPLFKSLYEHLKGMKLSAKAVLRDYLLEQGCKEDEADECIDTFIVNAKFLGLLRTIAGAERVIPVEQVIEESPALSSRSQGKAPLAERLGGLPATAETADWASICFYITPIGDAETEQRRHSDLFLNHLVEPALAEFGLKVVRADQIGKPGMITAQILEHIVRARLVVADLSFHNPNVFYELSLRHACRKPTVHLIRLVDPIPFDLEQFRTIQIDDATIYSLVPHLLTYRAEIATQVRRALADADAIDNPLTIFFPGLQVSVPTGH